MMLKFLTHLILFALLASLLSGCKKENDTAPQEEPENTMPVIHWQAGQDITISDDLYIDSVRFIIDPGVTVKIKSGCSLIIGDHFPVELTAIGTPDQPINFIPLEEGNNFWGSIIIKHLIPAENSPSFEYCNFIKGGSEGSEAVLVNRSDYLNFNHNLIDYSYNYGVLVGTNDQFNSFHQNTIRHTQNHPVSIASGSVHTLGADNMISSSSTEQGIYINNDGFHGNMDVQWNAQTVPYIIDRDFNISCSSNGSLRLKLQEGVTIKLDKNVFFVVGKNTSLFAEGTSENPVKFTSLSADPQPGDWNKISFYRHSYAYLSFCIFEYGGTDNSGMVDNGMIKLAGEANISMLNCVFRFSEGEAITLHWSSSNNPCPTFNLFSDNTFTDLGSYAISLYPQSIASIDDKNNFNDYGIFVKETDIKSGYIKWKNLETDYFSDAYISIGGESYPTVEIEPGVRIKWFNGGLSVWKGKLVAKGTENEPIIFTSATGDPSWGDWGGILFNSNTTHGSILDYCEVLYAGEPTSNMWDASVHICCNDSSVTISNSTIAHSSNWGLCVMGDADPTLENNTFFDNLSGDKVFINNK